MGSVSASLRKTRHVKGNLKYTGSGFERPNPNALSSASTFRLAPLRVDGTKYPLEKTPAMPRGGSRAPAVGALPRSPLRFPVGHKVTLQVAARPMFSATVSVG